MANGKKKPIFTKPKFSRELDSVKANLTNITNNISRLPEELKSRHDIDKENLVPWLTYSEQEPTHSPSKTAYTLFFKASEPRSPTLAELIEHNKKSKNAFIKQPPIKKSSVMNKRAATTQANRAKFSAYASIGPNF